MKTTRTFSIGNIVDAKQISKAKFDSLIDEAKARDMIEYWDSRVIGRRVAMIITLGNGVELIETVVGRRKTSAPLPTRRRKRR